MNTAKTEFDALFNRMKNSTINKFEIKKEVEDNWLPNGAIPFDLRASKGVAIFTVWANSKQDAEKQVDEFLERDNDE